GERVCAAIEFIPSGENFAWLILLAWVCSVWAFYLAGNALKRLSAFTVNLTYNLEPVYGIILAFIIFKENEFLSKWFYLGFVVIAFALSMHLYLLIKEEKRLEKHATQ
ncbi:MAG TPA: EamA family transporter, partial [Chitinophagaceae bacterium]|nr:EamA family transporter [Chitinophagaceae bacterium]